MARIDDINTALSFLEGQKVMVDSAVASLTDDPQNLVVGSHPTPDGKIKIQNST